VGIQNGFEAKMRDSSSHLLIFVVCEIFVVEEDKKKKMQNIQNVQSRFSIEY